MCSIWRHSLTFIGAPNVHWPEVIFSYESTDKVLFSADGFGKFGANDIEDPEAGPARLAVTTLASSVSSASSCRPSSRRPPTWTSRSSARSTAPC